MHLLWKLQTALVGELHTWWVFARHPQLAIASFEVARGIPCCYEVLKAQQYYCWRRAGPPMAVGYEDVVVVGEDEHDDADNADEEETDGELSSWADPAPSQGEVDNSNDDDKECCWPWS